MIRVPFIFFICLLVACSEPEGGHTGHGKHDGVAVAVQAASTLEMARILSEIDQAATPEMNSFRNSKRAEAYQRQLSQNPTDLKLRFKAAVESLFAGDTEFSIAEFDAIYKQIQRQAEAEPSEALEENLSMIRKINAIAYMRLGEQQNCQLNHTSESCLIPIAGAGIHQLPKGSKGAREIYLEILKDEPEDLNSIWLLNLAAMTLGDYPEGVPAKYRIPESAFSSSVEFPHFEDIASNLGLDVNRLSGGSIVEDFDGDGFLDIMASSWGLSDQLEYFHNNGDGSFSKRTAEAGLSGLVGGLNMIHGDYNNDGFADVLVLRGAWLGQGAHPNSLIRNNGDGTFTDVTKELGLFSLHPTQTACWADFNNDGWLDIFIGNESRNGQEHPCELYINNGGRGFSELALQAGVAQSAFVKGVTAGDFNNDGRPDLYLSCLESTNFLFLNEGVEGNGQVRFRNYAPQAGVTKPTDAFPCWFFDYDNDGWLDLFVSAYSIETRGEYAGQLAAFHLGKEVKAELTHLYHNNGDMTFTNVASEMGLVEPLFTMGCNYGDLNNDGFQDFYAGTGEPSFQSIIPNKMYLNASGGGFQDVTTAGGFGHIQKGHGVSFADLDNDGDQDIYTVMGGAYEGDFFRNALFENPGNGNHWIVLSFEGDRSNRPGIGNRIEIKVNGPSGARSIHHWVSTGGSFGASPFRQEIGLGDAETIEEIIVFWPASGITQNFSSAQMRKWYLVKENADQLLEQAYQTTAFQKQSGHTHHH